MVGAPSAPSQSPRTTGWPPVSASRPPAKRSWSATHWAGSALNHGHGMAAEPLGICAEGEWFLILTADDGTHLGEPVVVLGAQPQLQRGEVLMELPGGARTDDGHQRGGGAGGPLDQPGDRHLRWRGAGLLGYGQNGVEDGGVLLGVLGADAAAPRGQPAIGAAAGLPGEKAAAQRSVQAGTQPEGFGGGQQFIVGDAVDQAVLVLNANEGAAAAQARGRRGGGDPPRRGIGKPAVQDLCPPPE